MDATRDGVRELHAVDLNDGEVSGSVRLEHGKHVRTFAWAPDAESLAYVSEDAGRLRASVVRFPPDGSRWDLGPAGGEGRISWADSEVVVFDAPGEGALVARRSAAEFEVVQSLPVTGEVVWARNDRVLLGQELYLCAGSWHFVDLRSGIVQSAPPWAAVHASAGLQHSAVVDQGVLRLMSAGQEIERLSLGACDVVRWSADGRILLSLDDKRRLRVTELLASGGATHRLVPGDYDDVLPWPEPTLDESGGWLKFHDRRRVYLSRVADAQPGPATAVQLMASDGERIPESFFLGSTLVYLVRSDRGSEVRQIDLRGSGTGSRVLASEKSIGQPLLGLAGGFDDGSWIGLYVGPARSGEGPVNLWVASTEGTGEVSGTLLAAELDCVPDRVPEVNLTRGSRDGTVRCETLRDAQFQP